MTSYQSVKTVECICTSLYDVVVRNERGNSCATVWRRSRISDRPVIVLHEVTFISLNGRNVFKNCLKYFMISNIRLFYCTLAIISESIGIDE